MRRINPAVVDRYSASGHKTRGSIKTVLNGGKQVLDYPEMVPFSTSVDTQMEHEVAQVLL